MKTPTSLKTETKELIKKWEEKVSQENENFNGTHSKKEFTFSSPEARQLTYAYTTKVMAEQLIDNKLNNDVLPRVGITPSSEVRILYDLTVGRFAVWIPNKPVVKKVQPQPKDSQKPS